MTTRSELRGLRMGGGAIRLLQHSLQRARIDGLVRLAMWLGVSPAGPWSTEGARRHDLVRAIMATEKRLARRPRARRWERWG